ncbi:MAG: hypothetical protein PHH93_14310, partial [Prolixibacteraceae bacterium]|nr:hypothetical protein [Prolixibacteraceae bacterium]
MKKIFILTFLIFAVFASGNCQEQKTKNRKQIRKERQSERIKEIQQLLDNKTFIFKATHAL